eukprot:CAMPEP_0117424840 /NCGR_PEP_ID=MMETSP0758-20121206/5198_1 /TAXON_ID=63605 /ORGANISM="Percolomonas cosmopolitus, Strain AE-1 (ATCC 50343)" /LENGTH=312 /DNA_ID=CAMNT_0005208899 /DNA_START=159 /DNA_END=1097 /DNA_ORIENTATION=+
MLRAPISTADLNMIQGTYGILPATLPAVGGNEGVGIITEVGSEVQKFNLHDRVIAARPLVGTWQEEVICSPESLMEVDTEISLENASVIGGGPQTAYRMLEDFVNLQPGDTVIQNCSNSMVGQSVIQIAKQKGLRVISIIRTPRTDQRELTEHLKQMGSEIVVSDEYAATSKFKKLISDLPAPKLALNGAGGDTVRSMSNVMAKGGVVVTYGGMSRLPVVVGTGSMIFSDIQYAGYWNTRWIANNTEEDRRIMLDDIATMIKKKQLNLFFQNHPFNEFDTAPIRFDLPFRNRKFLLNFEEDTYTDPNPIDMV